MPFSARKMHFFDKNGLLTPVGAHCTVLNDPDITQPLHFLFCITNAVFSANKSVFMFLSVIFTSEWCLHAKSSVIF